MKPASPDDPGGGSPHLPSENPDAPLPILGAWRHLYIVVILNLALLIALFYLFTRAFE